MKLEINNLTKEYAGTCVLDIPQLEIGNGEIVGIVGNNGAGKTTLFRLLLDLIEATSGFIRSNGNVVSETDEWKLYTGSYVSSNFVVPFYTPEEFFEFVGKLYSISAAEVNRRLADYQHLMNDEILGKKKQIRQFSEGNKQKIGIIAAMIVNPQILILDEPFNYLDPTSQIEMSRLLRDINQRLGTTVLVSSHNLVSVTESSTRILLLEKGKIIKDIQNDSDEARNELNKYFVPEEE